MSVLNDYFFGWHNLSRMTISSICTSISI